MVSVMLAALSAFAFLSPAKPGGYTVMDKDDRPSLEAAYAAGKAPLIFADDGVFALTNKGDVVSAAVFESLPLPNLLHTWRGLGVKVLLGVEFNQEGSAEYFRRSCAFLPFRHGADGVFIRNPGDLPPQWKEALDEAMTDARVIDYLRELADAALKHDDPLVRMEGRRVEWWFGYMEADWENLDCLRLECVAWAKHLEQLLGRPAKDLPTDYRQPSGPDTIAFRPYADLAAPPEQIKLEGLANKDIPLADGGNFAFSSDKSGFSFTITCTNGPELAQWRYPQGAGVYNISLYVPSKKKGEFSPYHLRVDLEPFWVQPRAATPGLFSYLYSLEERFTPYATGYARQQIRVRLRPQLRTFGPDHQKLEPRLTVTGRKGGGWTATVFVGWLSLYGQWPCIENGKSDLWYVGIDRLPDGAHPEPKRLLWPRGREVNFMTIAKTISLGSITQCYDEQLAFTDTVWGTAYRERLYKFKTTEKPTFHRYDLESDELFRKCCCQPLIDGNKNAWELIRSDKDHKGKLLAQNDTIQNLVWHSLDKMRFLAYNVGLLRRDYLRDRFAGKMPAEPKPEKKGTGNTAGADGDFIDAGDFNGMQLDDVEF